MSLRDGLRAEHAVDASGDVAAVFDGADGGDDAIERLGVHLVLLQHRAGAAAVLIGHHLGLSLFDDHLAGVRAFVDIHGDGLGDQLAARGHIVRNLAAGHYPGVLLANDAYLVVDEGGRYIEHGVVVVHQGDKGEFDWWLSTYFATGTT